MVFSELDFIVFDCFLDVFVFLFYYQITSLNECSNYNIFIETENICLPAYKTSLYLSDVFFSDFSFNFGLTSKLNLGKAVF